VQVAMSRRISTLKRLQGVFLHIRNGKLRLLPMLERLVYSWLWVPKADPLAYSVHLSEFPLSGNGMRLGADHRPVDCDAGALKCSVGVGAGPRVRVGSGSTACETVWPCPHLLPTPNAKGTEVGWRGWRQVDKDCNWQGGVRGPGVGAPLGSLHPVCDSRPGLHGAGGWWGARGCVAQD